MKPDLSKSLGALLRAHQNSGVQGGMADNVPAMVQGPQGQPQGMAAVSEGEYVIPADVVAMVGDGNTQAGAQILDHMVEEIRKMKGVKSGKQAAPIADGLKKLFNKE